MSLERLDKVLSNQNIGSRKEIRELAKKGLIKVNGEIEKRYDIKIDADKDKISVNGQNITIKRYIYIMMNKPAGIVSASRDPKAKTVIDLVPLELLRKGLFPAGRLDKDTEGLLIITNDGDFSHRMLSPKRHIYKLYEAVVKGEISQREIDLFRNGIVFNDGTRCLPAELVIDKSGENSIVKVKICEGKFHQVKKMFLAVGSEVLYLKRWRIGNLDLDESLKLGECRELTAKELERIFAE